MIKFSKWAEHFITLADGSKIKLMDHQKRILDHCFTPDARGKLPYETIIYSAVKKSGKTAVSAMVVDYWAFNNNHDEIIIAANKRDQATSKALKEARGFIDRNKALKGEVVRSSDERLELKNGTIITAIPNDGPAGEAGSNHGLTVWDELWGFVSERDRLLYEELTPVPTRLNSIRFISTYAGWSGQSKLLEGLYHEIFDDNDEVKPGVTRPLGDDLPCYARGNLFVYWDHQPRMPWQVPAYYESQRQQLRANTYLRIHENRWVSNESSLFDMDKWDACVDPGHHPPMPNKGIALFVGVDASLKKDRSAVVSVYKDEDGRILLGPKRFWQPSKANPMDLEATMEAFLLELYHGYRLQTVRYDPYQFHRSAMTLRNKGLPMQEYAQTTGNLTDMGQNLYDLVEYGNIILYACKDLRYEATCAVAKETERGFQITKVKSSQKIDEIVALAMAALPAAKQQVFSGEIVACGQSIAAQMLHDNWGEPHRDPPQDHPDYHQGKGKEKESSGIGAFEGIAGGPTFGSGGDW